ncbi:unnamed protein product [Tetraodon nigroviridis]|uniref:(spotted green pufferfish) hypothetical protein n=1 Tax=Tetraodon nigroviridis TaxID=99883 RepID=Q4RGC4_TETNG|nr:unnamed protein product [Tetraodon nigroviridis]
MAAANVTLENQLQSAQKNLLFLQQDHASTLKGLHAEIRRLQQQCTGGRADLAGAAAAPGLTLFCCFPRPDLRADGGGEVRCRELQRRCEELEAELKKKEEENAELLRDLEQKNAMISVLENTIKERERKYLEELKMKSHKLAVLSGELEQRASTIAYLTSQLHATKKKLLAGSSSEASPNVSPITSYKPSPPPPPPDKDRQPETPRRRMKKSLSQPLHPELTEVYRVGPRRPAGGAAGGGGRHARPHPFPAGGQGFAGAAGPAGATGRHPPHRLGALACRPPGGRGQPSPQPRPGPSAQGPRGRGPSHHARRRPAGGPASGRTGDAGGGPGERGEGGEEAFRSRSDSLTPAHTGAPPPNACAHCSPAPPGGHCSLAPSGGHSKPFLSELL